MIAATDSEKPAEIPAGAPAVPTAPAQEQPVAAAEFPPAAIPEGAVEAAPAVVQEGAAPQEQVMCRPCVCVFVLCA